MIRPEKLWTWREESQTPGADDRLTTAVGTTFALTAISKGMSRGQAVVKYEDVDYEVAREAIVNTYADLLPEGAEDPAVEPPRETQDRAKELLDGYKLRKFLF
jgi:hypothetical protein